MRSSNSCTGSSYARIVCPIAAKIDSEERIPPEIYRKMGELGFLGLPYPEEWGGAGGDTVSYAIAVEEIGRVCGSTGLAVAAHVSLGVYPIYRYGTPAQKERYLRGLIRGEYLGAFGLTEANAGSDAAGTRTTAVITTMAALGPSRTEARTAPRR